MAYSVSFEEKDTFKSIVRRLGMKARYDYRQKWWEVYGKIPPLYKIKQLSDKFAFIKKWKTDSPRDKYKQSVYTPKIKR